MRKTDVLIVGAGPAGVAAAIYAKRAGAEILIIDNGLVGGKVNYTNIIENYPTLSEPISGMEFGEKLRRQLENLELEVVSDEAEELSIKDGLPLIKTKRGEAMAEAVIIATGCSPKRLNVEGEEKFLGRGISFCAVCDGPLFREKEVAVVGGGDSACEEALYLARFVKRVHLIHRRNELRAVKVLQERVFSNPKITLHLERIVVRYEGDNCIKRVVLCSTVDGSEESLDVDGVFLYVGNEPNTGFIKVELEKDDGGFIVTDENMRTSVERVYAAGDVRSKSLRQIVTAAADGAIASSDAVKKYLED